MKSNLVIAVIMLAVLSACKGESDKSRHTAAVTGDNYTGTYSLAGIECYDESFSSTALAFIAEGSPVETWTISGNSSTIKDLASSCTATTKGRVVFSTANSSMTVTNQVETTNTGSDCEQTFTLDPVDGGTITPSSLETTVVHNRSLPDVEGTVLRDESGELIAVLTSLQVVGSPSDLCFAIYLKQ